MSEESSLRSRKAGPSAKDTTDLKEDLSFTYSYDPCHEIKDSLLSESNPNTNYRGLLNLALVLLVLSNARVALNNILQFGILIDPHQWMDCFLENPLYRPTFILVLLLNIFIIIGYSLEKLVSGAKICETTANKLFIGNIVVVLMTPILVNRLFVCNLFLSSVVCSFYSVVILKLVSYHSVNLWCRTGVRYGKPLTSFSKKVNQVYINAQDPKNLVKYPENLGIIDIYYFMFAPTLCYQINFPRTQRIRKRFLIKRLVEYLVLLQIMVALIQQWIIPAVQHSLEPFQDMSFSKIISRLLLLAVPNHIVWLLFFYSFFHSFMNITGELLRFGDRDFYHDWWNSESVDTFWQKWNIPVHKWCVRHLYKPMIYRGYSRLSASSVVFLVSAFFHEYIVSIPLKMLEIWSFTGMIAQIPFAMFVSKYLRGHTANIAIWLSLIIGQPLAILMYYHDYYVTQVVK